MRTKSMMTLAALAADLFDLEARFAADNDEPTTAKQLRRTADDYRAKARKLARECREREQPTLFGDMR